MDVSTRYIRNPDFIHRRVGDEEILVPVRRSGADLSSIYMLNAVGSFIWKLLDGSATRGQLLDALTEEFDVARETATAGLAVFLDELESVDAISVEGHA